MAVKKSVVVIDGNDEDRADIVEILSEDYNVLEAFEKDEAIGLMKKNADSVAAVVLDVDTNMGEGYDIIREIKKKKRLSKIPIVAMSYDADDEDELKALSMGVSDFIRKPCAPMVAQKRLSNIISLSESATAKNRPEKDDLTGVYLEDAFCARADALLKKYPNREYVIVYSDMENYQLITDLFGDDVGRNILVYMAKVLKHFISRDELCGRMGADHFVMFIKQNGDALKENLESIVSTVNDFPIDMNILLRFGIYRIVDRSMSIAAMCSRAMLTVNTIKGKYGQNVAYYDEKIWEKQLHEHEILNHVDDAIREKQFKVYFQPKYDLESERVAGAEALVRWEHPVKGFMNPNEFIPLFEKNGFITELDKYVWDTACGYVETWKKNGYPVVPISVNVSRVDIYDPDFIDTISGIISRHNLRPEDIHLEITETAYTENPRQIIEIVKKLKLMGFIIEMDDFGSGYSSLNMLNELPIDILKLDMGFVQGDSNPNSGNILSFIISLAKWMDYAVVAEGIETREQIQMLKDMDCNYVQGFYYAKPMPPDEFEAYMLKHNVMSNGVGEDGDLNGLKFKKSQGVMLIVDDIKLNRKILKASFSSYFEIVEKENGAQAYDYIKEHYDQIEVIMLDLVMPVMDGFTLMQQLNMDDRYKNIPIIVTSQGGEKSVERSFALGAADFVEKPYNLNIILHRVQNVVMAVKNAGEAHADNAV